MLEQERISTRHLILQAPYRWESQRSLLSKEPQKASFLCFPTTFTLGFASRLPSWGFPRGPGVKTLLFSAGGAGSIPVGKLRSHMPQDQKTRHNTEVVTNSNCNKFNKD